MMITGLLNFLIPLIWSLLAIVYAVYFLRTRRRKGSIVALKRLFSFRLLLPLGIVMSLSILRLSLVFIYPHQVGVVISVLQKKGIREQPLQSGLHWIVPLAEKVVTYPIYTQNFTMSIHPLENNIKPGDDSIKARTADGQVVILDCSTLFYVDYANVIKLHILWQDRYVRDLLRPAMRSIIRNQVAKYTVDEVNSQKRDVFVKSLNEEIQAGAQGSGLIIEGVYVRNITFSPEYAESVEQKQMAKQGVTRTEHEARQIENLARGKAERIKITAQAEAAAILIEAEAAAKAHVIKAQAEAKALRLVGTALDKRSDLLTYRYIEKLSPNIKAMLLPHEMPLILPLPELEKKGPLQLDSVDITPQPNLGKTLQPAANQPP